MSKLLNCLILTGIMVATPFVGGRTIQAQLVKSSGITRIGSEHEIKISTSLGLGLSGFERHTNIYKIDENGIEYDLFSRLRNPEIQKASDIPRELRSEILVMHASLVSEIENNTLDVIANGSEAIKERFEQIHQEAAGLITDEQRERIELAAAKVDIQKVGLSNFVESPANTLGIQLDQNDINQLTASREHCKERLAEQEKQLRRKYNQRWIDALPATQRDKILRFEECDSYQSWLETKLSPGKELRCNKKLRDAADLSRTICYSKTVRKRFKISDRQLEEIRVARSQHTDLSVGERTFENNKSVRESLTERQFAALLLESWQRRAERTGTIDELINGDVARYLALDDSERETHWGNGKRWLQSYRSELSVLREEAKTELLETVSHLEPQQRERLAQVIDSLFEDR